MTDFKYQPASPLLAKRMTPDDRLLMLAEQHAAFYREQLKAAEPRSDEARVYASSLLSNLITLGELDEATEIAPLCESAAELVTIKKAIEREDDHRCRCSNHKTAKREGGVTLGEEQHSRFFEERRVKSPQHGGKVIPVWACSKCTWRNAFDGYPDEITSERHRAIASANPHASPWPRRNAKTTA